MLAVYPEERPELVLQVGALGDAGARSDGRFKRLAPAAVAPPDISRRWFRTAKYVASPGEVAVYGLTLGPDPLAMHVAIVTDDGPASRARMW